MAPAPRPRNSTGVIVLVFVVLLDAGLLFLYWNWKAAKAVRYTAAGLNIQKVSEPLPAPPPREAPTASPPGVASDRRPPEQAPAARAARPPAAAGIGPGAGYADETDVKHRLLFSQAYAAFHSVQLRPKYRQSAAMRKWTRDFLSYPDLQDANRRFWKDHDARGFLRTTLRSPNFPKLLQGYAGSPDLASFARDLIAYPSIMASGREFLGDRTALAAVRKLTLPGIPSVDALMVSGRRGSVPSSPLGPEQAGALQQDPEARRLLESQGAAPVALDPPAARRGP